MLSPYTMAKSGSSLMLAKVPEASDTVLVVTVPSSWMI